MATVTKQFRNNFEAWAQYKIDACDWTLAEIEGLRGAIRKDLTPGQDQLRGECELFNAKGIQIPATIDDHEARYRLWDAFFSADLADIQLMQRQAA